MRTLTEARRTARTALFAGAAAAAMVATALVVGLTTPAYACFCVATDLETQAKQADAVFVGTPVDVTTSGGNDMYEVRVSDVYEGTADPVTTVQTASQSSACGIDLKLDQQYMFVGEQGKPHGEVTTGMCSGTRPISDQVILDVEKALGPATPYRDSGNVRDQGDDDQGTSSDGNASTEDESGAADETGGKAQSDDTDQASDGSDETGNSGTYAAVGVVLALAIGASFALPRLRRRNRGE